MSLTRFTVAFKHISQLLYRSCLVNLENVAFLQGSLSSFCEDMWEIERKAAKLFQKMLLWGFKESCITYNVCFLQSTCTHVTEFFGSKAGGQILQIYKILNFLHILYILYIFYVHYFFTYFHIFRLLMLLLIRAFISPNDGDFSDLQQKYFRTSKNLLYLKRAVWRKYIFVMYKYFNAVWNWCR